MKVLLVSPRTPTTFWSFAHAMPFVRAKAAFPPLGLLTVAAMLPRHWELRLIDLNVDPLDDADIAWADYVMLSAMIVHRESVEQVVARCHAVGRPVIAGGPLFTTSHGEFPDIDHFVLGEAEELMPEVVRAMESRTLQPLYVASERPDVTKTPVPRWDLVDLHDYVSMPVQFSRGCPYDCEFCDIIVMNGRKPRTKRPEQIIAELEVLRQRGWTNSVFLVDDNFIGNKKKVKELLGELVAWREQVDTSIDFFTEASVNLADDEQLLEMMTRAGFKKVFLGIETPALESLRECHKLQNTRRPLLDSVRIIQSSGMAVMGGFIVGFDNDTPDIFDRQYEFIQKAGVVAAMVGLLTALPETRLYKRLVSEGRLLAKSGGNNTEAVLNFVPKLDPAMLTAGYRKLMQGLYEPRAFYQRLKTFLQQYRSAGPRIGLRWEDVGAFLRSMWLLGVRYPGRLAYWRFLAYAMLRHPGKLDQAMTLAIYGHHFRLVAATL